MIKVFYNDAMAVDSGGYSPSAMKPRLVADDWLERSMDIEVRDFEPSRGIFMMMAHDRDFVSDVMACRIDNGHGNRRRSVANSIRYTVGSHYAAAMAALDDGVTCSPTSGFHHAGYDDCHGFCTINGLMVTAMRLIHEGFVKRVGIVDYDYHYGDGTADIIDQLGVHDQVVQINGYEARSASGLLGRIERDLDSMGDVGIVFYQAGADMHVDDPLGGLLSTRELIDRDYSVFEWCKANGVPVVWNFAGGYQREADGSIPVVLDIHRNTLDASIEVFSTMLDDVAAV